MSEASRLRIDLIKHKHTGHREASSNSGFSCVLFLTNPMLPSFSSPRPSPLVRLADEGPSWSCDFVGTYHGLVPGCCCFSADGSLLAVGFREVVTVWSTASWELLTTLSQPPKAIRLEYKEMLHQYRHTFEVLPVGGSTSLNLTDRPMHNF